MYLLEQVCKDPYEYPKISNLDYLKADYIIIKVCDYFGVKEIDLKNLQDKIHVQCRQIAIYFIKKQTRLYGEQIMPIFNYKNLYSVSYSQKKVSDLCETDPHFLGMMAEIRDTMNF